MGSVLSGLFQQLGLLQFYAQKARGSTAALLGGQHGSKHSALCFVEARQHNRDVARI